LTDFLDEPDEDQVISTDTEGMSVRIDTRRLDSKRRQEILTELARIAEQLKG
jgi:hypothetical protein